MQSFKDIKAELAQFGRTPNKNYRGKGEVLDYEVRHEIGTNRIVYNFKVQGESDVYKVVLVFGDVTYTDVKDSKHTMPAKVSSSRYGGGGRPKKMYYTKPNIKNKLMIRSSDPDFRFRFMKELASNNSLFPGPNSWVRYDARIEYQKNDKLKKPEKGKKFYKVTHPQGGSYYRATNHPDKGGREFMNPTGLSGYSYPVNSAISFLRKEKLVGL